ncbi:hypothetical protein NRP21_07275 [Roseomonas pecuniae]|uniref:Uncharacterized protein n=1 Tax=Roseomonas populi TaxID=3121582 RepID=A0ABT1X163_9PROT|nr:hypothetical protein [Roseomonas pecuniae]MCR0981846.1 hypothetical protein [Roseomonas pecuniae]
MDLVVRVARIGGLRFQKALHLARRLEPARGIAFQGFRDEGGQRLVADQHLAVPGDPLVAVADRRARNPVAVHRPRPHPVLGLLGILLALVLGNRRQQVLDQDRVRVLAELDRRAFQLAARLAQEVAQIPMPANVAGEAADIVDDDHAAPALAQ